MFTQSVVALFGVLDPILSHVSLQEREMRYDYYVHYQGEDGH